MYEVFTSILEVDTDFAVAKTELSKLAKMVDNEKACEILVTLMKVDYEPAKGRLIEKAVEY